MKKGFKIAFNYWSWFSESRGLRYGYIININDVKSSLRKAVDQAEKSSKVKIKKHIFQQEE